MAELAVGRRRSLAQLVRFAVVGGSNTVITLALFVLLQQVMSPPLAYTVVFALGLAYTTALTATVVFGSRLTWRTGTAFVGWYLVVYGAGLLAVHLITTYWRPSSVSIALVTVAITAPLNFLGGRVLFDRRPAGHAHRPSARPEVTVSPVLHTPWQ